MRRLSSPKRRRPGAARSIIACRRCAPSRSRTRCTGCANIASTGCGSMPCTRIAEPGEIPMLHDLSRRGRRARRRDRPPHPSRARKRRQHAPACSIPTQDPPRGKYRAQWNDDYHHAWHVLLTGETHGYYRDYQRSPLRDIARALGSGFVYQGEASAHRGGKPRGEPSGELAADRLRQFPAKPRPDRQPRARRPARKHRERRGDRGRAGDHLAGARCPDAVHGRGMGLEGALPVLLRLQGRSGRRRAQGPPRGIRLGLCEIWRRRSRSAGRHRRFNPRCSIGTRATQPAGRKRLALVRDLLAIRRRKSCRGLPARPSARRSGRQRPADRALAHGRWRNAAPDRQSVGSARSPTHQRKRTGTPIWGGEPATRMPPWSVFWRSGAR